LAVAMLPNGSSCECRIAGVRDKVHFILQSLFSKNLHSRGF
jgi:hypothetical protein